MSNEQSRRRARGNITDEIRHDLMIKTEFVKRPNRAMSVSEVAILIGGQASFNIAESFKRLEAANKIYKTDTEFDVVDGPGDEVTKHPRYRRVT